MASAAEQLARNLNFGTFAKAKALQQRLLFTLGALLEVNGTRAMEALQEGAFVDLKRGRPVPIPDSLLALSASQASAGVQRG